jgi:hypothetical protein
MGIETDDVEKIRNTTLQAIEQAKGRVVESNLKRLDAGQFAASIICEVPPDAAGPLLDRLKQAGRVARLDIDRKQTASAGSGVPATSRIERRDTRLVISIYNLANIAPRQTTSLTLAARSVEETYRSILNHVTTKNGRVITSTLDRHSPEQITASISFEVPSSDADATLQEIRRDCETMALTVTENPDTNNVTAAKRGFNVQVYSLSTVPPQQTLSMNLETPDVEKLAGEIVSAAESAGGRTSEPPQFSSTARRATGHLVVDVPAAKTREFRDKLKAIATVLQSESSKNSQSPDGQVVRTRFDLTLTTPDADEGLVAAITRGLTISARGLLWSLQLIVVGLLFVAPWVLVVAGLWKLWRRRHQAQETPQ